MSSHTNHESDPTQCKHLPLPLSVKEEQLAAGVRITDSKSKYAWLHSYAQWQVSGVALEREKNVKIKHAATRKHLVTRQDRRFLYTFSL